jgi:anti-anti-sigma regulatory factor
MTERLIVMGIIWTGIPVQLAGIALVRRGRFPAALMLGCIGLLLVISAALLTTGVRSSGAMLFTFALPIVLAGLMGQERLVTVTIVLSSISVAVTAILETLGVPLVGIAASRPGNIGGDLGGFVVVAIVLGIFTIRFGQTLRVALHESQQRNQRLEELEARAAAQERLLEENRQQRAIIQGLSVPVLPVSADTLIVPLVGALDTERLQTLQSRALHALERSTAQRLILDISGVPLVDSQVAQGLLAVVQQARLLGAEAVLVGIRPEVAQALVGIGVDLRRMRTYRDLEAALHNGK